jgi:N-methylhydantoinase B
MSTDEALTQIRLQIMWNRLISVVEEQAQTLIRIAFSTSTREAGDLSAGVFDLQGRMLAQAVTGTPGHINAMAASVIHFLTKYPVSVMNEGDVFITNDPWMGTGHLNDFTVVSPTFRKGKVVALFACTSHVVDVGGRGFGADATQVYEEGLHVPIMRLANRGEMNETLLEMVRSNVRTPVEVEGDLYALAACNEIGSRRLIEMMDEFGLESVDGLGQHIITTSHAAMLTEIAKLPRGRYQNRMRVDGFERDIDLVASLTIAEDGIDVDFTGTSPASNFGINVPKSYCDAYTSFGIRCVVGPSIPNNAGSLSAIRVKAPEGCILNALRPCAVTARHVTGQMLPDVVLGCLHQALNTGVLAEGTSCLWNPVFLGGHGLAGGDETYRGASEFAVNCFHTGGMGARPTADGLNTTSFPSGVRNVPIEVTETICPLIIWRKEYRADSGGPGTFRGGTGQVMEVGNGEEAPFVISAMFDRVKHPARGRNGGAEGMTGKLYLKGAGTQMQGKGRQPIPAGDRIMLEMPGGGGYGDPYDRDPVAVGIDVRDGFVSPEAARQHYGVVVDGEGGVDLAETQRQRERRPAR